MLSLFFSFNGRINRAQYWLGAIVGSVVGAMALVGLFGLSGMSMAEAENPAEAIQALTTFGVIFIPLMAVICWSGLALQVKRFHDRGRSGFLVLLPMAVSVPMTMSVIGAIATGDAMAIAAATQPYATILWILNLAFFVDLCCMPSKEGPNKYGDPPGSPRGMGPVPTQPSPLQAPKNSAEAATSLFSAQSAMDRAIAEKERAPQMPPRRTQPAAAMQTAAPTSTGTPSFGRRVPH
jgi:uncharacterized membrane protein YhaH (DUF805 family)